ncbi:SAM-dependent methyltransferase [Buchnera aphidicola (Neophyllaphis podocarpi)]|uniref:RlmE family RNA methyltransferase n=1 Tax=Buchnera aphidicola TaxID=9 RepID=UPI0031B873BC
MSKKKSKSSSNWLKEHFNDKYVKLSLKNNLRSRSWFKLQQIDYKYSLFKKNMNIIDLGSAPGGWSNYAINRIGSKSKIIACDILPMNPIIGVKFIQGDLRKYSTLKSILQSIKGKKINFIMSDISPNISGNSIIDSLKSTNLCELVLKISIKFLDKYGFILIKSFYGTEFESLIKKIKLIFFEVKIHKPDASRSRSREIFILAKNKKNN